MKKDLFIFLIIISCGLSLFANDAYVKRAGGSIVPIDSTDAKSHSTISMKSEVISIDLQPEIYHIHVDFEFYNDGEETTINVGFPQWFYGTREKAELINFSTTLNGTNIQFEEISNGIQTDSDNYKKIDKWFIREITFPAKSITKTSIDYNCKYSHQGFNKGVEYLFGTGKTWKGPIGKQTIIITNNMPINCAISGNRTFFIGDEYNYVCDCADIKKSGNTFTIVRQNISPSAFDCIKLEIISNYYTVEPLGYESSDDWILSNQRLSEKYVAFFTDSQLRLFRNLIFAWHGHIFNSKDINNWLRDNSVYFERNGTDYVKTSWYKPDHKVDVSELSEIEKYNLEIIQNEEKIRK